MDLSRLVREARQGSAAAQKCLFDLLSDQMMMLCRRYVKNRENAEEILLDGFFKLFRGLADFQFSGENQFYAWVKKIMVNECLMFLRKKNVFSLYPDTAAEQVALEEAALDRLCAAEIFSLILQLPVGYRTVFNLYAVEGMNHREISELLGITEGTSKSQLSKARSLLQKKISQNENDYVSRKTK